jgi:hypothetical protein
MTNDVGNPSLVNGFKRFLCCKWWMVVQRVDNWNAIYNIAIRYVDKVHIFKTDTLSFKTNLSHGREEGYIRRT